MRVDKQLEYTPGLYSCKYGVIRSIPFLARLAMFSSNFTPTRFLIGSGVHVVADGGVIIHVHQLLREKACMGIGPNQFLAAARALALAYQVIC